MMHIILADHYIRGRDYAHRTLGINPEHPKGDNRAVVIYDDEDYMKLSGISRDPQQVKVHDITEYAFYPKTLELLRTKGHVR